MNIINQQDINRTVLSAELLGGAITNRIDDFIGKLLRGDVEDRQARLNSLMSDGMQKMSFAQPYTTIEEKRVVRFSWCFCNGGWDAGVFCRC